jgi:transposase
LIALKKGWNALVEDESIFIHDSILSGKRRWVQKEKRPVVTVTGSHSKTIIFGVLSADGKQLFRQYDRFDSHSFIAYLEQVKKKFNKFILFVDRATQHRSKEVKEYLQRNLDYIKVEYFPVGSPELNAVEECWRQGKYNILSNCYSSSFLHLKQVISTYYRTRRFNLDIKKYLLRSVN